MPASAEIQLARDVDQRCRLRGTLTLRSGQVAGEYFDKYLFESDPVLLRRLAGRMQALIPAGTEMLGGLELGGVPLATMLSSMTGMPALFVRKAAKSYGTCRLAEGADASGRSVLLVEDVITTGGTVVNAARALRDLGASVTAVVCVIDRIDRDGSGSGDGGDSLAAEGIAMLPVMSKSLLDSVAGTS